MPALKVLLQRDEIPFGGFVFGGAVDGSGALSELWCCVVGGLDRRVSWARSSPSDPSVSHSLRALSPPLGSSPSPLLPSLLVSLGGYALWKDLEPSVAEPPSYPVPLDMTIRDSAYTAAQPHSTAQVPSGIPQDGESGFLRPKIKVCFDKEGMERL